MATGTETPENLGDIAEPKQWVLWILAAVLATILVTTVTLYAVASWTEILPRGETGVPGKQGIPGKRGDKGNPGKTGITGTTGVTGPTGYPGATGESVSPCTYNKRGFLLPLCSDAGDFDE